MQIYEWFIALTPIQQALLATLFTWFMTALGAAGVFLFQTINRKVLDSMLGFAAGVMIAASFWSLLAPAIEMAEGSGVPSWVPAVTGFLLGGVFLWSIDKVLPHLHMGYPTSEAEGIKTSWQRSVLLVLAITLHNIPEGLAVGVAFGALGADLPSASLAGAIALAIGIGLQNFPEGAAVSIPLRREGMSRRKSFWYGQISGIVEPIAGVVGAAAVLLMRPILPYALAFAAGAMIYVVVEELIPESQMSKDTHSSTSGAMLGFAVMMLLDVALG
jgi:ZIP family zinc transporter